MTRLSWILPAFNEAESLAGALERGIAALNGFGIDFEVIVIDDGSSDRTAEIADEIAAGDSRVRVLRNERNLNYGITRNRSTAGLVWVTNQVLATPASRNTFATASIAKSGAQSISNVTTTSDITGSTVSHDSLARRVC